MLPLGLIDRSFFLLLKDDPRQQAFLFFDEIRHRIGGPPSGFCEIEQVLKVLLLPEGLALLNFLFHLAEEFAEAARL